MVMIFQGLGQEFREGYDNLMELSGAVGPLREVTSFMSMPTDLRAKKVVDLERHKEALAQREVALARARQRKSEEGRARGGDGLPSPLTPSASSFGARARPQMDSLGRCKPAHAAASSYS